MRPPLLLAAHGTRDQAGVEAFSAFAERVAKLVKDDGVNAAGGFIELSAPPVRDAVAALTSDGPREIVAVPLMLSAAGHAKGDIPAALARERTRHPGLTWHYGRPLGPHPILLDLLADRIRAVADDRQNAEAVLLVGRGSTDPDANADVVKTARLLWEGREFRFAETAFVSLARPDVAEGLERCRLLGARQIVVARYFLFPGVLPDRVGEQARGYAKAHPELDIRCADVLGDCAELASLVYERYQEALAGDIRMNCDICVYRTAMPGFEHRVGETQHPHDHPYDHAHAHA
ncbi:MAG TPA: sirohydrochlorin chelatase [Streptosporangiaceae bacterium]